MKTIITINTLIFLAISHLFIALMSGMEGAQTYFVLACEVLANDPLQHTFTCTLVMGTVFSFMGIRYVDPLNGPVDGLRLGLMAGLATSLWLCFKVMFAVGDFSVVFTGSQLVPLVLTQVSQWAVCGVVLGIVLSAHQAFKDGREAWQTRQSLDFISS